MLLESIGCDVGYGVREDGGKDEKVGCFSSGNHSRNSIYLKY